MTTDNITKIMDDFQKIKLDELDIVDQCAVMIAFAEFASKVAPIVRKYRQKENVMKNAEQQFFGLFGSLKDDDSK